MFVKENEHFWVIVYYQGSEHLYPKDQWSKEQAIFDTFTVRVLTCLKYALTQIKDSTTKRLVAQEFWHSLNRKGLIPNQTAETLIQWTLE